MAWRGMTAALKAVALMVLLLPHTHKAAGTDEEAVMRKLRRAMHVTDPQFTQGWKGWQPDDPAHPCTWDNVACNEQQQIKQLDLINASVAPDGDGADGGVSPSPMAGNAAGGSGGLGGGSATRGWQGVLLPELAGLPRLERLLIYRHGPTPGSIPQEWGLPGAFPRLTGLSLSLPKLGGGALPDFRPGALPLLEVLDMTVDALQSTLPASWGSSPDVLPSIQELAVQLHLVGDLPEEWGSAGGLQHVVRIIIHGPASSEVQTQGGGSRQPPTAGSGGTAAHPAEAPASASAAALPRQLPPAWAATGRFPKLVTLVLSNLGLAGTFPPEWLDGGFPVLANLYLPSNRLEGTLPPDLFQTHPSLESLTLESNQFWGALPDAWGQSKATTLALQDNQLTGPAFPPIWLQPGALPLLEHLELWSNPGLTGTLPASLPWPKLWSLGVSATGVHGSIPESYCGPQSALRHLGVKDTAVDHRLPSCTLKVEQTGLPGHSVWLQVDIDPSSPSAPGAKPHIAMLPLGALAAAGAVSGFVWRSMRRQRQRRPSRQQPGLELLLQDQQQGSGAGGALAQHPQGGTHLQAAGLLGGPPRLRKRARLAALLSAELGSTSQGVAMLPLAALPATLAHHLGSLRPASAMGARRPPVSSLSSGGGAAAAPVAAAATTSAWVESSATALVEPIEPHLPSESSLPLPAGRAAGEEWAAECSASDASSLHNNSSRGSAAQIALSRQWGLDTLSLQVPAGELQFIMDTDGLPTELGAGAHAAVYLAALRGTRVAVKLFELLPDMDSRAVWQEASLLRQCIHARIVPLLGVAIKGQLLMLAMPLMVRGSLRSALRHPESQQELRWEARGRQVAADVAEALAFLHGTLGLMHGDIKAGNVLLCEDFRGSLADLGLAQVLAGSAPRMMGFSRCYAAPEQLMGQRCTLAADMYSFGIFLIELITREMGETRGDWRLPQAPGECPQGVVELIQACLSPDPSQRPSAPQALQRLQAEGG